MLKTGYLNLINAADSSNLEEDEHILIAFSVAMTNKAARWWEYAEKVLPHPKTWQDTKDAFLRKYGNVLKKGGVHG